jgi:GntR family transcriptional regulator / MocR family aminotransferase
MEFHVSLSGRSDLSGEIYRQLRGAMIGGQLRPGDPLPPTRELARQLAVSRTTVSVAYERLAGEGFVTARIGAGTFVSEHLTPARPRANNEARHGVLRALPVWDEISLSRTFARPALFDFRTGVPDGSLFPHEAWRRLIARQLRAEAGAAGAYEHPAGQRPLREAIARHIGISRGVQASADDVTITNGTQQALDVVARALLAPGERVAVEDPGYAPPRWLFKSLGARIHGVRVDRDGLDVSALPDQARLVYVTPAHQYPLGVAMTLPRRLALLRWAERHNAAIVEDDYDSEFRFGGRPIEPLRMLDATGRVVYIGSFSKTMLPTLRLGFVVSPPSIREAIHKAKGVSDWHTSTTQQAALASFIDSGGFARHIRKVRGIYQARHELIAKILLRDFARHLQIIPSTIGLHVTALAGRASAARIGAIAQRAFEAGVAVQELAKFGVDAPSPVGLVLGYGAIPAAHIEEGLRRLRACFGS